MEVPVWPALFLPPAQLPGPLSRQLLLFHLPFWWRGDIDDGFRLRTGVSPSVFRFSVSTGRFALSCCVLPLTNHPLAAKDTNPSQRQNAQHSQMTGIERREKSPGQKRGNDFPAHDTRPTVAPSSQGRPPPLHHWWQG